MSNPFASLRSRVVVLAVVPSLILLLVGTGAGWYLAARAQQSQSLSALVGREVTGLDRVLGAVLDERAAASRSGDTASAEAATSAAVADLRDVVDTPAPNAALAQSATDLRSAFDKLAQARRDVRSGARGLDAFATYDGTVEELTTALHSVASGADDAELVAGLSGAADTITLAENLHSSALVAAVSLGRPLDTRSYRQFVAETGQTDAGFTNAVAALPDGPQRAALSAVLASPAWKRLSGDVDRLVAAGPGDPRLPVDERTVVVPLDYLDAGTAVAQDVTNTGFAAATAAATAAGQRADAALNAVVIAVLAVLAIAAACVIVAVRAAGGIGRRLARVRAASVENTERLPALLERIRGGEPVDVAAEIPQSDTGGDEIGDVAAAVGSAQRAAVEAAAQEARTRAGANAVFVNIAHRSQAIVHRQLQVLDEAERAEPNADQLARLFQLDHLTTRERRNAENLIIMGGQQPRRQWRRPVPLADIVRSAVSESEQYTRITLADMPSECVEGAAVGDLVHLFAELVDNATSYSPPRCSIDIQAGVVGRGIIVEIQDRGLGIEPEPRERLNAMLAEPPDFSLLTLSEDSRLGLFVVSRLAHRHGVRVTLRESAYGGVQALVLVPRALLVEAVETDVVEGLEGVPDGPASIASRRAATQVNGHAVRNGTRAATVAGPEAEPGSVEALLGAAEQAVADVGGTGLVVSDAEAEAGAAAVEDVAAAEPATAVVPVAEEAPLVEEAPADLPLVEAEPAAVAETLAAAEAITAAEVGALPPLPEREVGALPEREPGALPPLPEREPAGVAEAVPPALPERATVAFSETGELPPLPEREPQQSLARELRPRPSPSPTPRADGARPDVGAQRSSAAMSALQRGGRNGRTARPEDGRS